MTIQQFCIQHNLPLTRTARLIRHMVHERALTDHPDAEDIIEIGFDYNFADVGVRASKEEYHTRIQYEVADTDRLLAFALAKMKYEILSESDLDKLVDATSFLDDLVHGRTEWRLIRKADGIVFSPNRDYFDAVARILRKVGGRTTRG